MPGTQGTSFIPKRNPTKKVKRNTPRPVFIGTIIVRVFFFSVLIAALVIFAYEKKLTNEKDAEVISLNQAIDSFDEDNMQKILEMDTRIYQAKNRLDHTVSIVSIFDAIESSTIHAAQIENFNLERKDDVSILIDSEMKTDSFDSVIFQRKVIDDSDKLAVVRVTDLTLNNAEARELKDVEINKSKSKNSSSSEDEETNIVFKAELAVGIDKVPHIPNYDSSRNIIENSRPFEELPNSDIPSSDLNQPLNEDEI